MAKELSLIERVRARGRVRTSFVGETMTKGSFKDSVDINRIMAQFTKTRMLPQSLGGARFEDLSRLGGLEYQEAMNTVIAAGDAFAALPSRLRDRFGNDPELLLRFLGDPENREEATRLGLLKAAEVPPGPPPAAAVVDGAKPPEPPRK